ncbi:MAG: helix-turn-helix domain-containing protein [Nitrospirales bacterium]
MATGRLNPRLVKIHRNYTVDEIAKLYGVHKNTVRRWLKDGLPVIDHQRPIIILGLELADFLYNKRKRNKRPCRAEEMFCVRCRKPQTPKGGQAVFQVITRTQGNLIGLCPSCGSTINRGVNPAKLEDVCGNLKVTIREAPRHLTQSTSPSVNGYLGEETEIHEKAQPKE